MLFFSLEIFLKFKSPKKVSPIFFIIIIIIFNSILFEKAGALEMLSFMLPCIKLAPVSFCYNL